LPDELFPVVAIWLHTSSDDPLKAIDDVVVGTYLVCRSWSNTITGSNATHFIASAVSGTEAMRIVSNTGNVGLSTISPNAKRRSPPQPALPRAATRRALTIMRADEYRRVPAALPLSPVAFTEQQ
jgi:hypothetical protein